MDAVILAHAHLRAAQIRAARGIATVLGGELLVDIEELGAAAEGRQPLDLVDLDHRLAELRRFHRRQANPDRRLVGRAQRLHHIGNARRIFGGPFRRQRTIALAVEVHLLAIVDADQDHRDIKTVGGDLLADGLGPVEEIRPHEARRTDALGENRDVRILGIEALQRLADIGRHRVAEHGEARRADGFLDPGLFRRRQRRLFLLLHHRLFDHRGLLLRLLIAEQQVHQRAPLLARRNLFLLRHEDAPVVHGLRDRRRQRLRFTRLHEHRQHIGEHQRRNDEANHPEHEPVGFLLHGSHLADERR